MNHKFRNTGRITLVMALILVLTAVLGTTVAFIVTKTPSLINTFINGVDPTGDLTIHKTVTHPFGKDYKVSEKHFTFRVELGEEYAGREFGSYITDKNGTITLIIPGGATATIRDLPAGITAAVTESDPGAGFVAPGPVSLTIARGENYVNVVNDYRPAPADASKLKVSGTKTLVGRKWQEGDSYTFALEVHSTDENGKDVWTEIGTQTVTYADGSNPLSDSRSFDFTELVRQYKFDTPGDHVFRVIEKEGTIPGVTYDPAESRFTVTVGDKKNAMDGTLKIEDVTTSQSNTTISQYDSQFHVNIAFRNSYAPVGSAEVIIPIRKILKDPSLTGRSLAGFEFELYDKITGERLTVTTDSLGQAQFRRIYEPKDIGKTFLLTIREKEDAAEVKKGMTFDPSVYIYQVEVTQNEDGTVNAAVQMRKFDSVDAVPGNIDFDAEPEETSDTAPESDSSTEETRNDAPADEEKKQEESDDRQTEESAAESDDLSPREERRQWFRNALEFMFSAFRGDHSEQAQPTETKSVEEAVSEDLALIFPENDEEENTGATETTETSSEENTEPSDLLQQTEEEPEEEQAVPVAQFTNIYTPKAATLPMDGVKRLTGRELKAEEFTFQIFETDAAYTIPADAEPIRIATNDAEGIFTFLDLELTQCGWHYFAVKEDSSEKQDGIRYDDSVYHVSALVQDIGGELSVQSVTVSGKSEDILFENQYAPLGTRLKITGEKKLYGRELKAGEFRFNLYRADPSYTKQGEPVKTVNGLDASNVAQFSFEIAYEKENIGVYHYVISEDAGTDEHITYDTGEYGVQVMVRDDGEGHLVAEITQLIRLGAMKTNANQIVFMNLYTGPVDPTPPTTEPDETTDPTETTKPSSSGKLPQTGQLWWPVPVLLLLGTGFIVVDVLRRRGNKHGR